MNITTICDLALLTTDELEEYVSENATNYSHYGLPVIKIDGEEFAIAMNDKEADKACYEYIENTIWAFSPYFLEQMTDVPAGIFEALHDKCDLINEELQILVMSTCGMDCFVEQAISDDGRGYFIAICDGKEIELDNGAYAYQI